jgi:hypothetical protein
VPTHIRGQRHATTTALPPVSNNENRHRHGRSAA